MSSTTNDLALSLEMATANFQQNILALWEKEKEYRKLLDEDRISTKEALLKEQGFVVYDNDDYDNDIAKIPSMERMSMIKTDYLRLNRYDIIELLKGLQEGTSQDHKKIFSTIEAQYLSNQDPDYGILLSCCYSEGLGTEIDVKKHLELECTLAEKGHPLALTCLAKYYINGEFVTNGTRMATVTIVTKDIKKAIAYYKAATHPKQKDFYIPHLYYGIALLHNRFEEETTEQNIKEGLLLLEMAAENKHIYASIVLAQYYFKAGETCSNRYEKCYYYAKQAADLNHCTGILLLARCYEKGYGVTRDHQKYVALLHKAAAFGSKRAISLLDSACGFVSSALETFPNHQPSDFVVSLLRYCFEGLRYGHSISYDVEHDVDSEDESIDKFQQIKKIVRDYNENIEVMQAAYKLCCQCLQGHLLDHPTDSLIMGTFYQEGFLVPRDIKKAAACFKKAADLGSKRVAEEAANALMLLFSRDEETFLRSSLIFSYYKKSSKNTQNQAIYEKSLNHVNNFMPFFDTIKNTWEFLGIQMPIGIDNIIAEYVDSSPEKPDPVKPISDVNQTETDPKPRSSWCKQDCSIM